MSFVTVTFVFNSTTASATVEAENDEDAIRVATDLVEDELGVDASEAQEIMVDGEPAELL